MLGVAVVDHGRQLGKPGSRLVFLVLWVVLGIYICTSLLVASSISALARFTFSRSVRFGFFKRLSTRPWEISKSV